MKYLIPHLTRTLIAALWAASIVFAAPADAAGSRDILWEIITNCLDPKAADYCATCRWPRPESSCAQEMICKQTTEVWAETDEYVALRDRKMCGCPPDFVHGLAVPRSRVTGVEDPRHPDGIWEFSWGIALKKAGPGPETALAVNPPGKRAQDQLHVHIVRLQNDARQRFPKGQVTRVSCLDNVWKEAAKTAAAAGFTDYGILVTTHPDGGFLVLVCKESPEKTYVVERCK